VIQTDTTVWWYLFALPFEKVANHATITHATIINTCIVGVLVHALFVLSLCFSLE
jgi:hypothetical protein